MSNTGSQPWILAVFTTMSESESEAKCQHLLFVTVWRIVNLNHLCSDAAARDAFACLAAYPRRATRRHALAALAARHRRHHRRPRFLVTPKRQQRQTCPSRRRPLDFTTRTTYTDVALEPPHS